MDTNLSEKKINFYGSLWLVIISFVFSLIYILEDGAGERQLLLVIFSLVYLGYGVNWRLALDELSVPIYNIGFILFEFTTQTFYSNFAS